MVVAIRGGLGSEGVGEEQFSEFALAEGDQVLLGKGMLDWLWSNNEDAGSGHTLAPS